MAVGLVAGERAQLAFDLMGLLLERCDHEQRDGDALVRVGGEIELVKEPPAAGRPDPGAPALISW